MTNGKAHPAERHPPTANGTATDPSRQKAPQQPGPQPDEPKPQKQSPTLQPPASGNSSDSKAGKAPLQAHANGGPPEAAPAAAEVPATAEWTEESQKLLVNALKEIGKEVPDRCAQCQASSASCMASFCLSDLKFGVWCRQESCSFAMLQACFGCIADTAYFAVSEVIACGVYRMSLIKR